MVFGSIGRIGIFFFDHNVLPDSKNKGKLIEYHQINFMDANKFQYPKGSEWRKWDLHVHTPLSMVQQYGGDTAEVWEKFISDLEKLPAEFKVIGINDYLFIEGYKKVLDFKRRGRLQNIDLILPVIEFRLKEFVGNVHLRRLNYHIIFADESRLTPEQIDAHFLSGLKGSAKLDSKTTGVTWGGVVTPQSLTDFGKQIRENTPVGKREQLVPSDLELGFNNINFELSKIEENLGEKGEPNTYLENNYFKAIGKSEWEDFRWDGSPADKKTIINGCNFVFCASATAEQAILSKQKLEAQVVNSRLLHCSDAHYFSDATGIIEGKIGNCYTWIKADPTFEGLKQVIFEPQDRVFIGQEPPVIDRVRGNKTKYLRGLRMQQVAGYDGKNGIWFKDIDIEFNNELVAIIGNKGSGKSAIADVLGLLGNTRNAGEGQRNLSFLNPKKFKKKGYAENFEAQLLWEDESYVAPRVPLNRSIDPTETEKVKYLPQSYFESLTNELEINGFDQTLKSVTFLHIPEEERLGLPTFDDLEKAKSKNVETDLQNLKNDVHIISEKIIGLEKKKHPSYRKTLQNEIEDKEKELVEHGKNKPKEVKDPSLKKSGASDPEKDKKYSELTNLNTQHKTLDGLVENARTALRKLTKEKEDLTQIQGELVRFETQISTYKIDNREKFQQLGLDIDQLIKNEVDLSTIKDSLKYKNQEIANCQKSLRTKAAIESDESLAQEQKNTACQESHVAQQEILQNKIDKIKLELNKPERDFQDYKEILAVWEARKKEIEGTKDTPKTLEYLKNVVAYLDGGLVTDLESLRSERLVKAVEIFNKKKELVNLYNLFKQSIDAQLAQDKEFAEKFKMEIEAGFKLSNNFPSKFLGFINKAKLGSFKGGEERQVKELFEERDLLDETEITTILKNIISSLEEDQRAEVKEDEKEREVIDQVDNPQEFYDFVFSLDYLEQIYQLKLDEKVLDELSPGEKGALLLVFYLIIDKEDIPLVIDQPEDNLDNKSVFQVLTRFIKAAKKRRQIIIVTHNPNLAVGADAEQIIYVELDKKDNHRFGYELGAIEHPEINNRIVEILEGTMPAFDNRKLKYRKVI